MAQQTSCSLGNSKIAELQQQWISSPLELSSSETKSAKANTSPPVAPCVFPQAPLPQTIQSPPSSVYPTINQAMGFVRPVFKNASLNKGGSDNCPSTATITSEIKTSSTLAPDPICAILKASDMIQQQQSATSITGIESLQSYKSGAICPSALENKFVAPNSAASSKPLQIMNSMQESPKYSFQLPTVYSEKTILPTYAQKPNSSPTASTYSVFTEPPNLNLCSPRYYVQKTPCTVADIDPININPVSSLPISDLPCDTQEPQVLFLVPSNTPTETTIVQDKDKLDINIENDSSAIVLPEENYGNFEIVNKVIADNANVIDEAAILLDDKSGASNSEWPINLVINYPSVNVPAQSVTYLPTPSSICASSLPSKPAPMVTQFVPTPTMPIIVNSSKSKLKSLLPIIMMSLLKNEAPYGGGCSCNCGIKYIPIPYPLPVPTNCPIINAGREGSRKSRHSKGNYIKD